MAIVMTISFCGAFLVYPVALDIYRKRKDEMGGVVLYLAPLMFASLAGCGALMWQTMQLPTIHWYYLDYAVALLAVVLILPAFIWFIMWTILTLAFLEDIHLHLVGIALILGALMLQAILYTHISPLFMCYVLLVLELYYISIMMYVWVKLGSCPDQLMSC